MSHFEYKVIPAPARGLKGKGVKGADGRFANALETAMNDMAAQGWEYQRAETLPCDERAGLTGKTTTYRNVLVFRRLHASDASDLAPKLLDAPNANDPEPDDTPTPSAETVEPAAQDETPRP